MVIKHWHRLSREVVEVLSLEILKTAAVSPCPSSPFENSCLTCFSVINHQKLYDHVKDLMQNNSRLGLQRYEITHLLCYGSCFQCWAPGHPSEGRKNFRRDIWHSSVLACSPFHPNIFQNFQKKNSAACWSCLHHHSTRTQRWAHLL